MPDRPGKPVLEPQERFVWERLVRRMVLPKPVKFLAFVLASYADQDGTNVRPGVERLADITGFGTATIKRSLKALRDEYGLLQQVSRGGGRGGKGTPTNYRLTIPADFFDRTEVLSPDDRRNESEITQAIPQGKSTGVDNSETRITEVIPEAPESEITKPIHEKGFQGSLLIPIRGMRDQNDALRDHPDDPLPKTNHLKMTTTTAPDVTSQRAVHSRPSDARHHDTSRPGARTTTSRCPHGLRARRRPDGSPTCALCRRETTQEAS